MSRGLPAVLVPPGDKQVTVSRCRHPNGRQLHGNEGEITGTFTHSVPNYTTGAGITPKCYPALPSPGEKSVFGNEQTTAEQGGNKKGASHRLWKLKLKQTEKKAAAQGRS